MLLEQFNDADRSDAVEVLRPCVDVQRWCEAVADARPYATRDDLLGLARTAAHPFTAAEVRTAMSHHPRIGEKPAGAGTEAVMSAAEQSGVDQTDATAAAALRNGNRAYEEKFGRVFLIRAAGRSADEILSSLHTRLQNSPEAEDKVVAEQLREIALLRLEGVITA
jgi:2-oxo-4-hydroxy-4-carboxy-5-ureidoimidazoline decarboxylase